MENSCVALAQEPCKYAEKSEGTLPHQRAATTKRGASLPGRGDRSQCDRGHIFPPQCQLLQDPGTGPLMIPPRSPGCSKVRSRAHAALWCRWGRAVGCIGLWIPHRPATERWRGLPSRKHTVRGGLNEWQMFSEQPIPARESGGGGACWAPPLPPVPWGKAPHPQKLEIMRGSAELSHGELRPREPELRVSLTVSPPPSIPFQNRGMAQRQALNANPGHKSKQSQTTKGALRHGSGEGRLPGSPALFPKQWDGLNLGPSP